MTVTTLAACTPPDSETSVEATGVGLTCTGQKDKVVTTDYLGAREEIPGISWDPVNIGHSAAAELLWSQPTSPSNEQFAAAWISKTNRMPFVRRYSTASTIKNFLGPQQQLGTISSPGWIRHLGFDDNCGQEIPGAQTCAWFTWENDWGYVNWRAIGNNGNMSGLAYWPGHQPSGDTGQAFSGGQLVRKKLLAWISSDRTQVKATLLYDNGLPIPGTERVLHTTSGNWKAYQTAVAWSSNDELWLVAWTEHTYPQQNPKMKGLVYTRYMDFNGSMGTYLNGIMYCEGNWWEAVCPGLKAADPQVQPSADHVREGGNPWCLCKGFWLASSYYSGSAADRYRLQQYRVHARLNNAGIRQAIDQNFLDLFSPITEAGFWYGPDRTPFQALTKGGSNNTEHTRLVEGSFGEHLAGEVFGSPFSLGQAFRSDGSVAVALGTDGIQDQATALKLSIVDVKPRGCP